eukprot:GHVU01029861.1.p2 GENE.GHVU01029861.1~~GHVU01029861.1.p2  ORF type:complete len:115 (-),score=6.28 GHVU01029861.1:1691-2035(-)
MVHDDVMATTHSHLSAAHPSFPLMSPESLRCIRSLVVDPNTNAPSRDWYEACLQGNDRDTIDDVATIDSDGVVANGVYVAHSAPSKPIGIARLVIGSTLFCARGKENRRRKGKT